MGQSDQLGTRRMLLVGRLVLGAWGVVAAAGCWGFAGRPSGGGSSGRGGVVFVAPRCVEVRSCLLGQVTAAETATPLAQAAVFLEREGDQGEPVRITTLTDDQGVFTVADAPRGSYRLAIYKDARRIQARGLRLGEQGTILVPVRLPPGPS